MSGRSVVFVLPSLEVGGSERYVAATATGLAAAGERVVVVCLGRGGRLARDLLDGGVRVVALGCRGVKDPRTMPALLCELRRHRPDVVHAFLGGFDLLAAVPARLAGVDRVLGSRRELAWWMRGRHRLVERLGTALVDRVICCSDAVRRDVLRNEPVAPAAARVVRTGVELARFSLPERARQEERARLRLGVDDVAIVTVANFDVEKGYEVLLEAARLTLARCERARFFWAGEGPLRGALERRIADASLTDRVTVMGHVDDVPRLLAGADLFALASISEGLPHALLEAMAAGRAAVATRVGGIPEVLQDRGEGRLVPPADPSALARVLIELASDGDLRRRLGSAARRRAEREHGLDAALRRYRRIALGWD